MCYNAYLFFDSLGTYFVIAYFTGPRSTAMRKRLNEFLQLASTPAEDYDVERLKREVSDTPSMAMQQREDCSFDWCRCLAVSWWAVEYQNALCFVTALALF